MFIVDPNINRLNILMIPWIYYTAVGTAEFTGRFRRGLPIAALLFTAAFFTFARLRINTGCRLCPVIGKFCFARKACTP